MPDVELEGHLFPATSMFFPHRMDCLLCAIHFCRAQTEHACVPICPLSSLCSLAFALVTLMASQLPFPRWMASQFLEEMLRMTQHSKISAVHQEHFQLLLRTRSFLKQTGSDGQHAFALPVPISFYGHQNLALESYPHPGAETSGFLPGMLRFDTSI